MGNLLIKRPHIGTLSWSKTFKNTRIDALPKPGAAESSMNQSVIYGDFDIVS